jgi:site-specific DNA-methyltransferase (adenine-specific)
VYGSGFPKSHDVSKAIDKAAGAERGEVVGISMPPPDWQGWEKGFDAADIVRHAGRDVSKNTYANGRKQGYGHPILAPATDAARQWSGWGTALKPSWEPVIVARKPLASAGINVLEVVESELRERGVCGEILWKAESASGAARSSRTSNLGSTRRLEPSATSAKSADESEMRNADRPSRKSSGRRGKGGRSQGPDGSENFRGCMTSDCANPSFPPTVESVPVAESQNQTFSPSTTSTVEGRNTESPSTGRCTLNFDGKASQRGIECFAGIATGLTGCMATVRINRDSDGAFLWPKGLPEFVRGSPLTVAENVLRHGTGGINVDGCRVASSDQIAAVTGKATLCGTRDGYDRPWKHDPEALAARQERANAAIEKANTLGRWPANLIHDGSEEVVGLFPNANGSKPGTRYNGPKFDGDVYHASSTAQKEFGYGDTGSAARFFYCAKASKADRDEGCEGIAERLTMRYGEKAQGPLPQQTPSKPVPQRNHHPTVKPTALMRYLCRLVTPPGGIVLDPFTGSGSTGKAAVLEGFRFIGIEREAEYVEIARARIAAAVPPAKLGGMLF